MKELISKRSEKIAEMEEIKEILLKENRSAMTADEKAKFETLKNEITGLNERIEGEKFLETEKRAEVKNIFVQGSERKIDAPAFNFEKAFRSFSTGKLDRSDRQAMEAVAKSEGVELRSNEFYIPNSFLKARAEQRAQTTSNSSAQGRVLQGSSLSFVPTPILYQALGVTVYDNLVGGKLDLVSAADFSVSFGTENSTITDASYIPAKATLTPRAVNATAAFSRELLNQTNPEIMNSIMDKFALIIDKAIDKELFNQLSGLTATVASASTYQHILTLEAGTNATPSAFLSSFKGRNYWKSKVRTATATDSNFIWANDNTVAGYPAMASPQVPNGLAVLGNFSEAAVGKWSGLVIIVDPYSSSRQNLINYSVIQMCDVKVVNAAAFAITKNGSFI
jgi:HK97 family phage major capsid protein